MKKTIFALTLGMASTTAFANTGSINFYGTVYAGTCPIEIIEPSTGQPTSRIRMGNVSVSEFAAVGDEAALRAFGMRVTPGSGCIVNPGGATVTFTAPGAGTAGSLYALEPGGANDLALVIKDNTGRPVDNGTPSSDYPVDDTDPTTMMFSVAYKSTGPSVTAGAANADVQFLVAIP